MSTDPKTVRAARLLISQLGLTPEDLMWVPTDLPTFRDYVPHVIAASGGGAKRTYSTYWTSITKTFGDKRLDEVTPSEIEALMRHMVDNRLVRRNDRGGHSVAEHLISAMRAIYTRAINDKLLPPHHNPAGAVPKPRRRPNTRHGLSPAEVTTLADAVTTSGHDAVLDTLLFRLHLETACRRGGALALREDDIEPTTCLIQLREKNSTIRWQPVSPTLIASLLEHRRHRGNDTPTPEPWVAARNISTHWLRHTTLTWVERHYGPSIARGYAGHAHPRSDDITAVYTKPTIADLATALAAYTHEPHPLASTPPPDGGLPGFPIFNPLQP
ncbi:tyrosine-type recombinase/integrase [Actinosynnema sp. CA-248983]